MNPRPDSMIKTLPLTPRQQERRHRILEAARQLLAENGYDGMVLKKVAERASVSPTTLYNLYNSKDELLLAALRELIGESTRDTAADVDEMGYEFILRNLHYSANQSLRGPAYAEAIAQAVFQSKSGDALIDLLLTTLSENITLSLEAMQTKRQLKPDVDPTTLAKSMTGAFWSTHLLWTKGLINLADLEQNLLLHFLSLLIPASRGHARRDLESRYAQLL